MTAAEISPAKGGPAHEVLVDRIASWLLDHEPGRRLPRRSQLAHSYQATPAQVDTAIAVLARRGLVRETADGHVYKASPAEYLVTFDGLARAGCRVDPAGSVLACVSRHVVHHALPEEIAHALRLPAGSPICAVQSIWSAGGTTAALSTTYTPGSPTASPGADRPAEAWAETALDPAPPPACAPPGTQPGALRVEMQPPPRRTARSLRIRPSEAAVTITVRFDDQVTRNPAALTVTVLNPARFHIAMEAPGGPSAGSGASRTATISSADGGPPAESQGPPHVLHVNGVSLDLEARLVHVDGAKVTLARKEYDLLCALMENAGQVISNRELLDIAWSPGYVDEHRALAVYVCRLRRKLDPGTSVSRIRTVRGLGYVFDLSPPGPAGLP